MSLLERRSATFNTLLPSLCDCLHTKLAVYTSAFSLLEVNADLLVGAEEHVACHALHVACHVSHVTRLTSHVTRHTSHVTRHSSQVKTTSHAVLPTSGGDDLKKVAAAVMKRSARYCSTCPDP